MSKNKELREAVAKRANGCCEYCRSQDRFAIGAFAVDHVIPKSQQGETQLDNLAWSCQGCNEHKHTKTHGRDLLTEAWVLLYNPRQQRWSDHFVWNENFSLMIGITPAGRATVNELKLNREGVVNLRRVLYEMGEHPPIELMESVE